MADFNINSAEASDLANAVTDYSVGSQVTDGATGDKETKYSITNWAQNLGYYKQIPELRAVIDAKDSWTVGKGFKADEETTMLLDTFKGFGKDTFNTFLENMLRVMNIAGDSFAEIIRDDEENLINLKTLDPSTISIIADAKGLILRYEQNSKLPRKQNEPKIFQPEDIFHLSRNRVADEIHGVSLVDALENVILSKNEAMSDMKTLMHWHVKPRWKHRMKTDDPTKISAYKAKADAAKAGGEDIYEPIGEVESELIAIAPNATLNPMAWITYLDNMFYEVAQVPKIILGGSGEFTEASAKIAYLAFQQTIEEDQLFVEEQCLSQLNLVIDLEFPASLENELLSDKAKDGPENVDPSETTAGEGQ